MPAVGRDGCIKPFEKPWFMVLLMFAGEGGWLTQGMQEINTF
jgi:hypothetical protein